jgi:hypothetical protein
MKDTYSVTFDLDVAKGETKRGTVTLEGVVYDVVITPESNVERLRKLTERIEKIGSQDPTISLGPRGGCPLCGR